MANFDDYAPQLIALNLRLASIDSPLTHILVEQAVRRFGALPADHITEAVAEFRQLATDLSIHRSPGELAEYFSQKTSAISVAVGKAISDELAAKRLVHGATSFVASYTPLRGSIADSAVAWLGQKLKDADVGRADALIHMVDNILPSNTPLPKTVEEATAALGATPFVAAIKSLVGHADPVKGLKDAAGALLSETMTSLSQQLPARPIAQIDVRTLASSLLAEPELPGISPAAQQYLAGAHLLQSSLRALGATDAANDVSRAVGYAQSAAQIYQGAALLMTVSTGGWGAMIAMSGLSNGINGVGMFGGGNSSGADQTAVLAAIQQLLDVVRQGFAQVNAKLDEIIGLLKQVLTKLEDLDWDVKAVQDTVLQIDRKLSGLVLASGSMILELSEQMDRNKHTTCTALVRNRLLTKAQMAEFRAFYHDLATRGASSNAKVRFSDGLANDRSTLEVTFAQETVFDAWAYQSVLATVLASDYHVFLPGAPMYQPALRTAAESYAGIMNSDPKMFMSLDPTESDEQIEGIRAASAAHTAFVGALRGDGQQEIGTVMSKLLTSYDEQVKNFAEEFSGCVKLWREAYFRSMDAGDGTVPRFAQGQMHSPAATMDILGAQHFGAAGSGLIANAACSFTPTSPTDQAVMPLEIRLDNWSFGGRDPWSAGHQRYYGKVSWRARYRDQDIPGCAFSDSVLLWVQGAKIAIAEASLNDLVALLKMADAPGGHTSGVEKIINPLTAALSSSSTTQWFLDLHSEALDHCPSTVLIRGTAELQQQGAQHSLFQSVQLLERTGNTIRAVARLAFEDVYANCDVLQALLGMDPRTSLLNTAYFNAWTAKLVQLNAKPQVIPAGFELDLPAFATKRATELRRVLEKFYEAAHARGGEYSFRRTVGMFETAVARLFAPRAPDPAGLMQLSPDFLRLARRGRSAALPAMKAGRRPVQMVQVIDEGYAILAAEVRP
jgi:hypothetical protein